MKTSDVALTTFLEHYGIKGMKWGVRRDQRTLDRLAGRKTSSDKPPSRSKRIKNARAERGKLWRDLGGEDASNRKHEAESRLNAGKSKADELQATLDFERAYADLQKVYNDPKFAATSDMASQLTNGEMVALAVLTGGAGLLAYDLLRR